MGAVDLIRALMDEGVEFVVVEDRIRWRNSGGRVSPTIVTQIAEEKAEVLKFLRERCLHPATAEPEAFPHGVSINGMPRTWTGRVVSLEEWQRLSDWDRHGSTGKVWNGLTRNWQPAS